MDKTQTLKRNKNSADHLLDRLSLMKLIGRKIGKKIEIFPYHEHWSYGVEQQFTRNSPVSAKASNRTQSENITLRHFQCIQPWSS